MLASLVVEIRSGGSVAPGGRPIKGGVKICVNEYWLREPEFTIVEVPVGQDTAIAKIQSGTDPALLDRLAQEETQ